MSTKLQDPPDRSGAIWVTATGALLLFAAAATFVAVRWDDMSMLTKFAALIGATQVVLAAGWWGRGRVPATAAAAYSLGVVLMPLDAWTIAAVGAGTWQRGLAACGVTALCVVPLARRFLDTAALRLAEMLAVPLAAAGGAAVGFRWPTVVVVAAAGVAAAALRRPVAALCWTVLAGVMPLVVLAEPFLPVGHGVVSDLGLRTPWWGGVLVGGAVVAAAIVDLRRRGSLGMAPGAMAIAAGNLIVAGIDGSLTMTGWWSAAVVAVLLVEVAASLFSRDPLLGRPLGACSDLATAIGFPLFTLLLPFHVPAAAAATCLGLVAVALLLGDDRRNARHRAQRLSGLLGDPGSLWATWGIAAAATEAALIAPLPLWSRALLALGVGASLLLTGRVAGVAAGTAAVAFGAFAALSADLRPAELAVVALCWVALAVAARRQPRPLVALWVSAQIIPAVSLLTLGVNSLDWMEVRPWAERQWIMAGVVAVTFVLGVIASPDRRLPLASVGSWVPALLLVPFAGDAGDGPWTWTTACLGAALAAGWTIEAMRRRRAIPGVFAVLVAPFATWSALSRFELTVASTGVGMAILAAIAVAAALMLPRWWRPFLLGAAGAHVAVGVATTYGNPVEMGLVMLIAGALIAVVGLVESLQPIIVNGAVVATSGWCLALRGWGVDVVEPYAAWVALLLAAAGVVLRRRNGTSSWIADTPAIVLLGGTALLARLDGAAGWHALVAGGVAVAAVVAGAWWRLAGPLFVGSALLAAVVGNETLRVSAGVPTWAWLALGGVSLLGSGVALELRGLGPIESGRRLIDIIEERFD